MIRKTRERLEADTVTIQPVGLGLIWLGGLRHRKVLFPIPLGPRIPITICFHCLHKKKTHCFTKDLITR